MSGQINKDINAVFANLLGQHLVTFSQAAVPVICQTFNPPGDVVSPSHICIAEYLHTVFVVSFEQRFYEVGARVAAKIRRHISHPNTSAGCGGVIGMGQNIS